MIRIHSLSNVSIGAKRLWFDLRKHAIPAGNGPDSPDKIETIPGLPQFAFVPVKPNDPGINSKMLEAMRRWPTLSAVVSVVPAADGKSTQVLVAGKENAVSGSRLEGVYEVVQRLSSSSFIKEQAARFPSQFSVVKPYAGDQRIQSIRIPGAQKIQNIGKALLEGGKPNQEDQLRRLVQSLPQGQRVVLLIAGPSAAGKSTLIRNIQELAGKRHVADFSGDMYFRDIGDPAVPRTKSGNIFWDNPVSMHFDEMTDDIVRLVKEGKVEIPVFDFLTHSRTTRKTRVTLGKDDILAIDSLHAANPKLIEKLEKMGLPHYTIYLDSPVAEDRLVRRIVRDYETRGYTPEETLHNWDDVTFPGEVKFVRPTILQLDPARDLFYITKFPNDPGLSREQIEERLHRIEKSGEKPTYAIFKK